MLETPAHHRRYNLAAPIHPLKQDFYTKMAEKLSLSAPHFLPDEEKMERIILADKICRDLDFVYQYPDPEMM